MTRKRPLSDLPSWPRTLTQRDAAAYLSVSVEVLKRLSVQPVRVGGVARYDRAMLDRVIDELAAPEARPADRYLEMFGAATPERH